MKFLVTADLHLRYDQPVSRLDPDWGQTQRDMLQFIVNTANQNGADIVITGDVYNSAIVPARVSTLFLEEMRKCTHMVCVMAGNHSLIYHREENADESSIGALKYVGGNIVYMEATEMKEEGRFEHSAVLCKDPSIVMVHTLTFKDEIPFGAAATTARELLAKYKDADILFLGDNHTGFIYEENGRYAINPGAPILQSAAMIGYKPRVYIVDTDTMSIEAVSVPHSAEYLKSDHLEEKQKKDERITAFIETIKKGNKVSLSFEDNLKIALVGLDKSIIDVVEELFAEEGK
jgi:DNA repair exonuclease SbcCD nuclease subunit